MGNITKKQESKTENQESTEVRLPAMCNNSRSYQMERSTSPMPDIQRALFKFEVTNVSKLNKKRSSRPSLEDDLKKISSSPLLGADYDKENSPGNSILASKVQKSSRPLADSKPKGLAPRDEGTVFRFSSSQYEYSPQPFKPPNTNTRVPRISVQQCEDDVFDPNCTPLAAPVSSKLVLTPSTAHTPRFRYSSSSSYSSSFIPSPSIDQGMLCNTPNRLQLEKDGLSTKKCVLGKGAYGTVVLGQYKGKKVAVKVMEKEEGTKSTKRKKSLESELQAMQLDHENIVRVYGVHAADDRHAVIIMEYVGSRNLHRLLVELKEKTLGSSWLILAAKQVSYALSHCHRKGVLHMDVKPANVMVTSQGVCKLGDFGCSVSTCSTSLAMDHSLVGTPGYQAPEFLRGKTPTPACDVYSMAILMWQLEAREVPFSGQHPQTVMFRVVSVGARPSPPPTHLGSIASPSFTTLYKSCWDPNPASRPSARQVVDALSKIYSSKTEKSMHKVRSMR